MQKCFLNVTVKHIKNNIMRELILKRIEEIRTRENGFPKNVMRWKNFSDGSDKTHISQLKFEEMNDVELLMMFERLIRRLSKQM